jgi:hypothetical protein
MSNATLIRINPDSGTIIDEELTLQSVEIPILPEQIIYDNDNNRYFAYVKDDRIYIEKRSSSNELQWTISNEEFSDYMLEEDDVERTPSLSIDFYNHLIVAFSIVKSDTTYVGISKINKSGNYITIYEELITSDTLNMNIRPMIQNQSIHDRTLILYGKNTTESSENTVKIIGRIDQTTGKQITQEIKILPPSEESTGIANITLNTISEDETDKQILVVNKTNPVVLNRQPFATFKGLNFLKIENDGTTSDDLSFQGQITSETNAVMRTSFKTSVGSSQFNKENTVFDESGNIIHTFEYKDSNNKSNIGLVKLDKNGFRLWESTASILTRSNNEYFPKLTKHSDGNIVLIFSTDSVSREIRFKNGFNIVIAKFNINTGSMIWKIKTFSIDTDNNDIIPAINIDGNGNIIIAILNDVQELKIIKLNINDNDQIRDTLILQLDELTSKSRDILKNITTISNNINRLSTKLGNSPTAVEKQEISLQIITYQTQINILQNRITDISSQITETNNMLDELTV